MSEANKTQQGGNHYKEMGVEPWNVFDTWPSDQRIGAYRANAVKYLMRMGCKGERLIEIQKCLHYVQKLIEVLEEVDNRNVDQMVLPNLDFEATKNDESDKSDGYRMELYGMFEHDEPDVHLKRVVQDDIKEMLRQRNALDDAGVSILAKQIKNDETVFNPAGEVRPYPTNELMTPEEYEDFTRRRLDAERKNER